MNHQHSFFSFWLNSTLKSTSGEILVYRKFTTDADNDLDQCDLNLRLKAHFREKSISVLT